MKKAFFLIFAAGLLLACSANHTPAPVESDYTITQEPTPNADTIISAQAEEARRTGQILPITDEYARTVCKKVDRMLVDKGPQVTINYLFLEIKQHPDKSELYLKTALILLDMQQPREALEMMENALVHSPDIVVVNRTAYYIYMVGTELDQRQPSLALLRRAHASYPLNSSIAAFLYALEHKPATTKAEPAPKK